MDWSLSQRDLQWLHWEPKDRSRRFQKGGAVRFLEFLNAGSSRAGGPGLQWPSAVENSTATEHWASSKRELAHPDERLQLSRWLDETSRAQTRLASDCSNHIELYRSACRPNPLDPEMAMQVLRGVQRWAQELRMGSLERRIRQDPTKLRERLRAAALYCRQAEAEASASAAAEAELQKAVPHLEAVLGVRSRAGTRREFQAESASAAVFAVCGPSPELEPKPRQLGQPRAASKRSRACGYNRASLSENS
eukprot:s5413_g9.t1